MSTLCDCIIWFCKSVVIGCHWAINSRSSCSLGTVTICSYFIMNTSCNFQFKEVESSIVTEIWYFHVLPTFLKLLTSCEESQLRSELLELKLNLISVNSLHNANILKRCAARNVYNGFMFRVSNYSCIFVYVPCLKLGQTQIYFSRLLSDIEASCW